MIRRNPLSLRGRGLRVGLLGGSFNPAHEGHLHISRIALGELALDEVWWLISPQNPLKPTVGMAPLAERVSQAARIAREPRIVATDIEARLGTRYTVDTLAALKRRYPGHRFVWLMGADNLIQLPRWYRWSQIFRLVPVAVFNRPNYAYRALSGRAAIRFARYRLVGRALRELADRRPPAWVFVWCAPHVASATAIRSARSGRTRLGSDRHR